MEIQNIFYGVCIFFAFLTIGYFILTYLEDVPSSIKAVLIFLSALFLFILGDYLRRLNK